MNVFLFLISCGLLVWFIYEVTHFFSAFTTVEKILTVFVSGCGFTVLSLEIVGALSLLRTEFAFILVAVQLLLSVLASLVGKWYRGRKHQILIRGNINCKHILPGTLFKKENLPLILFATLVAAFYLFILYCQFRFPQSTSDSLYNHLSRIAHWLQNGSLAFYFSFSDVGTTFPYNNSLLMAWPILFLRTDLFAGLVQYFANLITALTIYGLVCAMGFSKRIGLFMALIYLTFPIVAFQSITAQNDLLTTAFLLVAFFFLLRYSLTLQLSYVSLSLFSIALAIGTKQYVLFALPGYALFFVWVVIKNHVIVRRQLLKITLLAFAFVLFFGSYAYVQNLVRTGSIVGSTIFTGAKKEPQNYLGEKEVINSLRLFYQFISCEGVPPTWEEKCVNMKANLLRPAFSDLETTRFLLEQETPFKLNNQYPLNEESSWFGMQGFVIFALAFVPMMVSSVRKKKVLFWFFLVTGLIFWLGVASVKPGWDPYAGRYLIFSIVLIFPFTAILFQKRTWFANLFKIILAIVSFAILVFSFLNNDSKPLVSRTQFKNLEIWGMEHSTMIQKIAYKVQPLLRHEYNVWNTDRVSLRAGSWGYFRPILDEMDILVPDDATLVIVYSGHTFPDYLMFGENLSRTVIEIQNPEDLNLITPRGFYYLVDDESSYAPGPTMTLLMDINGWKLYKN